MIKLGLTAFDVFIDRDIERYKDYYIDYLREPRVFGIATKYENDEKIWFIYETTRDSQLVILKDGFKDLKTAVEVLKEDIKAMKQYRRLLEILSGRKKLNKITSFEIITDGDLEYYENYDINVYKYPNIIGLASTYKDGKKIWFTYETDQNGFFKVMEEYEDYRKALEETRNFILDSVEVKRLIDERYEKALIAKEGDPIKKDMQTIRYLRGSRQLQKTKKMERFIPDFRGEMGHLAEQVSK